MFWPLSEKRGAVFFGKIYIYFALLPFTFAIGTILYYLSTYQTVAYTKQYHDNNFLS